MTKIVIATPTGEYDRELRRFCWSQDRKCPAQGYCNATVNIGRVDSNDPDIAWYIRDSGYRAPTSGDNWPHEDTRWPKTCSGCGYEFADSDQWQRNDCEVFRRPDGIDFSYHGVYGKVAPPGTAVRADWWDDHNDHPQKPEPWIISLPDGGEWITCQRSSSGGYWTITGTMPNITVTPSIFHNPPTGWHGFITNGELTP